MVVIVIEVVPVWIDTELVLDLPPGDLGLGVPVGRRFHQLVKCDLLLRVSYQGVIDLLVFLGENCSSSFGRERLEGLHFLELQPFYVLHALLVEYARRPVRYPNQRVIRHDEVFLGQFRLEVDLSPRNGWIECGIFPYERRVFDVYTGDARVGVEPPVIGPPLLPNSPVVLKELQDALVLVRGRVILRVENRAAYAAHPGPLVA
mmetsp:Transcript_31220/g.69977  ORF Transcript_31220/g.69977 Transcript_31220/m.69977 type:complete len:204 (-) Transcript_31220:196-807(-)